MKSLRPSLLILALLGTAPALASEAAGPSPCGDSVVVRQADTLSSIANRCDIPEASLLDANPTIQGSSDLQVGATLHVPNQGGTEQKVGAAVSSFARHASHALGLLAGDVGSSVQDVLDKNPDLKSRLDRLDSKLGLSDGQHAPSATVSPQTGAAGSTVTITASGLPPDSPVAIGAGPPGTAYDIVGHAQSTGSGTVTLTTQVPGTLQQGQVIVFSVATGATVAARTQRFVVKQ